MSLAGFLVLPCLYLVLLHECHCSPKPRSVSVSLDTKWRSTNLLQEATEFLAAESNHHFWRFLNLISKSDIDIQKLTDKELHEFILKAAEKLLSPVRLDLLRFSLAIRVHSPAVEMFRKIAEVELFELKCEAAIDVDGSKACVSEGLDVKTLLTFENNSTNSLAYKVDHHFPGTSQHSNRVIFYVSIASPLFKAFHPVLKREALSRKYDYIVRHIGSVVPPKKQVRLSGYAVELQIKSTEYKAQDDSKVKVNVSSDAVIEEEETDLNGFNFRKLKELHPDLKDQLDELKLNFLEAEELTPLKVWQLQDLGFQAAQRVMSAAPTDCINVLQDISQNFPSMARLLTKTSVKEEFRLEVERNQKEAFPEVGLSAGDSALFINGLLIDTENVDVFSLLELLKKEEKLSAGFFRMGYRREYLNILTSLDFSHDPDSYAVDFRQAFPDFLNNLDTDKQYRQWGNSVKIMLQPYFPGMIRPIARNIFTLVFLLDPTSKEGKNLMKVAYSFWAHEIPLRIGMVWIVNPDKSVTGKTDAGVALVNLYNFAKSDRKPADALRLLTEFFDGLEDQPLNSEAVIKYFKKTFPGEDTDNVFGEDSDYNSGRTAGAQFLQASGLEEAPKVLLNGVPLDDSGLTADRFEETVINEIMRITPSIQKDVAEGRLTDDKNVMEFILSKPDVMPRLNAAILKQKDARFLDMTDTMEYHNKVKKLYEFSRLEERQMTAHVIKTVKYLKKNDDPGIRAVTVWVVCDLETPEGRELLYGAIKHLKHSNKMRIGLIHNPTITEATSSNISISKIVDVAMRVLPLNLRKMFLQKLLREDFASRYARGKAKLDDVEVHGMDMNSFNKELGLASSDFQLIHSHYASRILDLLPGQRALVVNGKIIGPLQGSSDKILEEDFSLLEKHALSTHAEVIQEHIKDWQVDDEDESSITIPATDETTAALDVVAIVNPLSRDAQNIAPLLSVLMNVINADFKIIMNPKPKLSEMPLKSFYRLVLPSQLQFASDGSLYNGPVARFSALPLKQLLTLNVQTPEAWLIESVNALYDLDNIKLQEAHQDIVAEFQLSHLLLEGHCFDEVTGNPPRGLQFTLGTRKDPLQYDTIVMANLGYFQLKANPGLWLLKLREGRSSEIYDITTHDNTESPPNCADVAVVLNSFSGKIIRIRVVKKPDKLNEHLLIEAKDMEEHQQSIWQSLSSKLTGKESGDAENHTTINIFSLASGHLYERFLRIMMLSVLKNTKHPVKFWFLKNYLSPYFKKFLPHLAQQYGFEYELVQYKWPRWLHQQTEKQRIIWGYKLLFLDVLFPLDVKKIIFVDADQVVRTDMMELMTFDLEGAPYGYTPFCESRKEMEGFRFWKKGYWANHLAGRKYHISALYVVDLKKFRQIAAGDRLRGQYQGLSADPNSLSNLDQDLPNNMIHQVKIKSLPQDWLWCETWCDDESKSRAKTIDLCNNPMTKEPKLESAVRIIDEWRDYDNELRAIQEKFDGGQQATTVVPTSPTSEKTAEKHQHTEF